MPRLSEKMSPNISIIIPNWNGKHLLEPCLDSILAQSFKDYETIVVDCVSMDGSIELVEAKYPSVKLVKIKEDKGPANAINVGCSISRGKYVVILNNDVMLERTLLEILVNNAGAHKAFVINPIELDWSGKFHSIGCYENWISWFLHMLVGLKGDTYFYPSTACCMTTRELLQSNPLNEDIFMYEDTEWGWRLQLLDIPMLWTDRTYFFHKGSGSVDNPFSAKKAFYVGLSTLSTYFICLRWPTMLLLSPLFLLNYLRHVVRLVRRRKFDSLISYHKGFAAFFHKIPAFSKRRSRVQKTRRIGDLQILIRAISSVGFAKSMRQPPLSRQL